MAFKSKSSNIDFPKSAPISLSYAVDIHDTTPEAVFEILKRPETWPHWFPDMTKAKWISNAGLGAKRKVTLSHAINFEEEFIQWEAPHSLAYQINRVTIPFADELVEQFVIDNTENGVRVTFNVGLRLHKLIRPASKLLLPTLEKTYKQIPESLKVYMNS